MAVAVVLAPVMMRIGQRGCARLSCTNTSSPLTSGRWMSRRMTSGWQRAAITRPSAPVRATSTTPYRSPLAWWMYGSRMSGSSSITNRVGMVNLVGPSLQEILRSGSVSTRVTPSDPTVRDHAGTHRPTPTPFRLRVFFAETRNLDTSERFSAVDGILSEWQTCLTGHDSVIRIQARSFALRRLPEFQRHAPEPEAITADLCAHSADTNAAGGIAIAFHHSHTRESTNPGSVSE